MRYLTRGGDSPFQPNKVARRARRASVALVAGFLVLDAMFFRVQVIEHARYALQSDANRLREVPLAAPRGTIYDRHGHVIAEDVPGYSVSLLAQSAGALDDALSRIGRLVVLAPADVEAVRHRYRRAPNRPTVVLRDVGFDVMSILEERSSELPELVIQTVPKRRYPDGPAVAAFVGYVGEVTEAELAEAARGGGSYKPGQLVGKGGLEQQYDSLLRGQEGSRFTEVDARGRIVRDLQPLAVAPRAGSAVRTTIDLELQRFVASLFGDSLRGGVVALDPRTGEVLALHSAPSFDANRFVGGINADYWRALNSDPRRPLFNKVVQARYPPASTWKLATAVLALQSGTARLDTHMPEPDRGGFWYGGRYFRDWYSPGHGDIDLSRAIEVSCNVYFYQLGLKLGLARLVAGGGSLGFRERTGIDLPNEAIPRFPDAVDFFDRRYGPGGWTNAVVLNLAIGQGENDQTLLSMARFYTALATDGHAVRPTLVPRRAERRRLFRLDAAQMAGLRAALTGVVSERGTAGGSLIAEFALAGKTGTAQNAQNPERDHAWFVGFAPAPDPQIVIAVLLEFGEHGSQAARIAARIAAHHLRARPLERPGSD